MRYNHAVLVRVELREQLRIRQLVWRHFAVAVPVGPLEYLLGRRALRRPVRTRAVERRREQDCSGTREDDGDLFHGWDADGKSRWQEHRNAGEVAAPRETRGVRRRLRTLKLRAVKNNPVPAPLAAAHDLALLRDQSRAADGAHTVG